VCAETVRIRLTSAARTHRSDFPSPPAPLTYARGRAGEAVRACLTSADFRRA
jgi:hypothetical protein